MEYSGFDSKMNPATNRTWDELVGADQVKEMFPFEKGFKSEEQAKREFHEEGRHDDESGGLKKAA